MSRHTTKGGRVYVDTHTGGCARSASPTEETSRDSAASIDTQLSTRRTLVSPQADGEWHVRIIPAERKPRHADRQNCPESLSFATVKSTKELKILETAKTTSILPR